MPVPFKKDLELGSETGIEGEEGYTDSPSYPLIDDTTSTKESPVNDEYGTKKSSQTLKPSKNENEA